MAFLVLFGLALAAAFILQRTVGRRWLSVIAPVAGFISFVLFDAYVLPYRGGGASMWPIAVLFGAPVALLGAFLGAAAGISSRESDCESSAS